jgi:hypothetical protein
MADLVIPLPIRSYHCHESSRSAMMPADGDTMAQWVPTRIEGQAWIMYKCTGLTANGVVGHILIDLE